jgi:hypothetical protein
MKMPSMAYRRMRGNMIKCAKYTHNVYKLEKSILKLKKNRNTRGHHYKLDKQCCNTSLCQRFFTQRVVERWNRLLSQVVKAPSVDVFKNRLDSVMRDLVYSVDKLSTFIRSDLRISSQYGPRNEYQAQQNWQQAVEA